MFLSLISVALGDDPDKPRPGRDWLRNIYRIHQRLCMAFPSSTRKAADPDFLGSFEPGDFGANHVHVQRQPGAGFLFRIDPLSRGRAGILVQSASRPDWDYAFHNASHFLESAPEVKEVNPQYRDGQILRFRLLANPTKKIATKSNADGSKNNGRRIPVPMDQLNNWLKSRAMASGFSVDDDQITVQPGYVYFKKSNRDGEHEAKLRSARYDGILEVTDHILFQKSVSAGIGPEKSLGFGLLSIAPAGNV